MANYSRAHICQCLSPISTLKRSSVVTVTGKRRKTGQQFVDSVYGIGRGLLRLGLQNGDVVAISAFNSDWYLEWILAVAFVGGIVAPLNYRWSLKEARTAIISIRPVMLVTDKSCSYWYDELQNNAVRIPSLRWHVSLDSPSSDFVNLFNTSNAERPPSLEYSWAPDGAVIICFTSGTTGKPKGVVISHTALVVQSLAKIAIVGYGEDDVYLHTAPLCHIGGLSSAISMLMVGACHVFIPKFEAKSALEAIERHCVTSLITVPTIMADVISLIREKEAWKGRYYLRKILNGGGGLSKVLIKEAINIFPNAKLVSAYGMTETTSSLTFTTLYTPIEISSKSMPPPCDQLSQFNQLQGVCVGKPAPHVEMKISSDGSDQAGRILTRGPHVMLKYWDQVSEPVKDFWLDTGDFGSIDQYGNVWLVGRTNFRIKSGGENVYPEEVEAVLLQCPGVSGIVVVSTSDSRLTEMVIACVQLRENWEWSDKHVQNKEKLLSSELLRDFCLQKNLTGFKIPKKFILWMKPFPRTTTGKIRRDEVRREVTSYMQLLSSNL